MYCIDNIGKYKSNSAVFSRMLLVTLMLGFLSCEDSLEKSPTDRFSDEAVWVDANLIEAFVNRTYREMPASRYNGNFTSTALIFGELTDELYGRGGNHNYINEGEVTAAQLGALDYWTGNSGSNYYNVITNCNIFFSNIDQAPIEEEVKNRMIGEMKVLRAFAYLRLVALYGGVPLITSPFGLNDEFDIPRNFYEECMNFVVTESDAAADLLPSTYPSG